MASLQDQVAIVTGASSGVGAAVARRLAGLGVRVLVNYGKNQAGGEATHAACLAAGGDALLMQGDVSDESACIAMVDAAVARWGRLDILLNNAGTTTFVPHSDLNGLTDEVWARTLQVNLMGAFYMSRAAVPHLSQQGGHILMTSSIAGQTTHGSSIAYCCSKAALNSLTRTLAKSLGDRNIQVNAVLPGLIDGDWAFGTWGEGDSEKYESLKAMYENLAPLSHVVTADDVADALLSFLTGSSYTTGQLLTLDAGLTL